ncbi:MAG: acetate/propionate family kinase [bacterium]
MGLVYTSRVRGLLTVNAGSSSLKYALFEAPGLRRLRDGKVERIGQSGGPADHAACVPQLLDAVGDATLAAIGHRIVHGGERFTAPVRVDAGVIAALRELAPFAPEHEPAEIALIEALAARCAGVAQVACFDTAFHAALPRPATLLPIPLRYAARGVRRYGFHGLSYQYLMSELARLEAAADTDRAPPTPAEGQAETGRGRVLLAHLGSGCSLAAVRDGRCIDTTMGFTPAGGLVMGTRSGDLDPGLVAYLARADGLDAAGFDHLVNAESGLLGLSETSADVRDLLAREADDTRAAEALAVFCRQAIKHAGALTAMLGGLDTLVFAGGIGEHAAPIRARIASGLKHLGVELDMARNANHAPVISTDNSRVTVRVIPTDEELQIARETAVQCELA